MPIDIAGLPRWATSERYDVTTTSSLSNPTPDERTAMQRAMLADRFKLAAHIENRDQPVYDLVLARSDGQLGPGIKPSEVDCVARAAAQRAAGEAGGAATLRPPPRDFNAPPPSCTLRVNGPRLEGDATWPSWRTCYGWPRAATCWMRKA